MKLSVVVPVYNKAPFLQECFDSILSQSFGDLELIVVDDRSTDNGLEVLRGIKDERMKLVPLERNLGPGGAAQYAMDLAQGEYIIRVDADDICLPDRFAKQVAFMDRNPGLGASGGHMRTFGDESGVWRFPVGQDACKAEILFGNPVAQGTAIMRTRILRDRKIRFEVEWPRIGEDWMLWARLLLHCEFDNLDEPLIMYRRGDQNSSVGLDRVSYRKVILRDVFRVWDIPLSEEQCDLHLMSLRSFVDPPSSETILAFRNWMEDLCAMNRARSLFPQEAFELRLRQAWDQLFYSVARSGVGPALAHYRLGPERDPKRLIYLAKYTISRWLGRVS